MQTVANQEPEQKADITSTSALHTTSRCPLSVTAPHPKHSYYPASRAVLKYLLEGLCTIVRKTLIIREIQCVNLEVAELSFTFKLSCFYCLISVAA